MGVVLEDVDTMPTKLVDICEDDFTQIIASKLFGLVHDDALAHG